MKRTKGRKCDKVKKDERRREVVISLSFELEEESDPSRTNVPETVALASAGMTQRKMAPTVLTLACLVRKGQADDT